MEMEMDTEVLWTLRRLLEMTYRHPLLTDGDESRIRTEVRPPKPDVPAPELAVTR